MICAVCYHSLSPDSAICSLVTFTMLILSHPQCCNTPGTSFSAVLFPPCVFTAIVMVHLNMGFNSALLVMYLPPMVWPCASTHRHFVCWVACGNAHMLLWSGRTHMVCSYAILVINTCPLVLLFMLSRILQEGLTKRSLSEYGVIIPFMLKARG